MNNLMSVLTKFQKGAPVSWKDLQVLQRAYSNGSLSPNDNLEDVLKREAIKGLGSEVREFNRNTNNIGGSARDMYSGNVTLDPSGCAACNPISFNKTNLNSLFDPCGENCETIENGVIADGVNGARDSVVSGGEFTNDTDSNTQNNTQINNSNSNGDECDECYILIINEDDIDIRTEVEAWKQKYEYRKHMCAILLIKKPETIFNWYVYGYDDNEQWQAIEPTFNMGLVLELNKPIEEKDISVIKNYAADLIGRTLPDCDLRNLSNSVKTTSVNGGELIDTEIDAHDRRLGEIDAMMSTTTDPDVLAALQAEKERLESLKAMLLQQSNEYRLLMSQYGSIDYLMNKYRDDPEATTHLENLKADILSDKNSILDANGSFNVDDELAKVNSQILELEALREKYKDDPEMLELINSRLSFLYSKKTDLLERKDGMASVDEKIKENEQLQIQFKDNPEMLALLEKLRLQLEMEKEKFSQKYPKNDVDTLNKDANNIKVLLDRLNEMMKNNEGNPDMLAALEKQKQMLESSKSKILKDILDKQSADTQKIVDNVKGNPDISSTVNKMSESINSEKNIVSNGGSIDKTAALNDAKSQKAELEALREKYKNDPAMTDEINKAIKILEDKIKSLKLDIFADTTDAKLLDIDKLMELYAGNPDILALLTSQKEMLEKDKLASLTGEKIDKVKELNFVDEQMLNIKGLMDKFSDNEGIMDLLNGQMKTLEDKKIKILGVEDVVGTIDAKLLDIDKLMELYAGNPDILALLTSQKEMLEKDKLASLTGESIDKVKELNFVDEQMLNIKGLMDKFSDNEGIMDLLNGQMKTLEDKKTDLLSMLSSDDDTVVVGSLEELNVLIDAIKTSIFKAELDGDFNLVNILKEKLILMEDEKIKMMLAAGDQIEFDFTDVSSWWTSAKKSLMI